MQDLPDNKYNIQNLPPDKYRDQTQEVLSNNEYLDQVNGVRSVSTEQTSTEFAFEASRDDEPSKTDYTKG